MIVTPQQLKNFEAKYIPVPFSGCWLWTAALNNDGYARFFPYARGYKAAFEHWKGSVPEGKEIDHICGVRCCVNPAHLQAITHKENIAKSGAWEFNRKKTHCPKGHPYSGDNLYMYGTNRQCLICRRARSLIYMRLKRQGDSGSGY